MGQEPDQIRQQIAHTRETMGETIDALGYKADVPARAKDKVSDTVDRARESVAGTVESIKGAVTGGTASLKDVAPDRRAVSDPAREAAGIVQQNPLGLAIGSAAAGFLVGMLLPATRVEDERVGSVADDVKQRAVEVGQDALQHGKQIAKDAAETAEASMQEGAARHAEELRTTAQDHVQAVTTGSDAPSLQPPEREIDQR